MGDGTDYVIQTDVRYRPLETIDVDAIAAECEHDWFNQTLTRVNDCVVRLGVLRGEFHWHHHDDEDEFFYVVDGTLLIDLDDRSFELGPGQGLMVPRTIRHRTRAPDGAVVLMFEGSGVVPTGD